MVWAFSFQVYLYRAQFFSLTEASRCGGMKSFPVSLPGGAPIWQGEGLELQAPEVFRSLFFCLVEKSALFVYFCGMPPQSISTKSPTHPTLLPRTLKKRWGRDVLPVGPNSLLRTSPPFPRRQSYHTASSLSIPILRNHPTKHIRPKKKRSKHAIHLRFWSLRAVDAGIFLVDFLVLVWLNSPESQGGLDACPHFRKKWEWVENPPQPGCDAGRLFLWLLPICIERHNF